MNKFINEFIKNIFFFLLKYLLNNISLHPKIVEKKISLELKYSLIYSILLNFDERRSAALSSTLLREHGDGGVPISSSASMRKAVLSNRNMYGEQPSANTSIHGDSKSVVRDKKAELSERSRADTKEENPYIQIMQSMVNTWESNATPTGWKEFKASFNGPDGIEKIEQARAALFEIKTSSSRFQRLFDALEKIESRINERLGNRPRQGPAL